MVWEKLGMDECVLDGACIFWLWSCAFNLDLKKFKLVVCGCWLLWFNRTQLRHGQRGWECGTLIVPSAINGRNRQTIGLWGYCQLNNRVRRLIHCDGSFNREEIKTMEFAVVETSSASVDHFIAGWELLLSKVLRKK
ncbi:hypothetical protein QQ045_011946 [Rhodiola kirilowii]